jgi:Sec-independent protein translocase protein TatA
MSDFLTSDTTAMPLEPETSHARETIQAATFETLKRQQPARSPSPTFQSINTRFTVRYAIAVLAGVVPVFISAGFWWIPVVAMIGFFAAGYKQAVDDGMIYEFADAFYYLGFTLSIGALLAALDPFHASTRPNATIMLHQFGLGMLTTLIGVTGRTVLQSYHRLPSETLESVNRQIAEQGHEYLDHLQNLNSRTGALIAESVDGYQRRVVEPITRLGSALAQCIEAATQTLEQASALRKVAEQGASAIGLATSNTIESVGQLNASAAAARTSVLDVSRHLGPLLQGPEGLPELASQVGRATRVMTDMVTTDVDRLKSSIVDLTDASSAVNESARKIDPTAIAKQLAALEESLTAVASTVSAQGRLASDQAQAVQAQLEMATKAAEQVNSALEEVASAVTMRLQQIA